MPDPLDLATLVQGLPRLGPGSEALSARVAGWARAGAARRILEVGCGHGGTSLVLAARCPGLVVASDLGLTYATRTRRAAASGTGRVVTCVADLACPPFAESTFDAVVAEGCLYPVGLRCALATLRPLLTARGRLVFTHFGWTHAEVPDPVKSHWEAGLPEPFAPGAALPALLARTGFAALHVEPLGRSEWDAYYDPLRARVDTLARQPEYADPASRALLEAMRQELRDYDATGLAHYTYFLVVAERDEGL